MPATETLPTVETPRAPWGVKGAFGVSGAVSYIVFLSFELFVLFYYSQVLGLSPVLAGTALLISTVVDAVVDPVIGTWSDNLRSRFGRRHLFMFGSIVPVMVFFVAVFAPPRGLEATALFAWMTASTILLKAALSFFESPGAALAAEISPLKSDRAEMGILRQVMASLAQIAMVAIAFNIFFKATPQFANGQENAAAYPAFALSVAFGLGFVMLVSAAGTWRHVLRFERGLPKPSAKRFVVADALGAWGDALLRMRNFRAVFFGLFIAGLMGSTYRALNLYLGTYVWKLDPAVIRDWQQLNLVGMLAMALLARFIVQKIEPKALYLFSIFLLICAYGLPPGLTALGLLPPVGSVGLQNALFAFNTLAGAAAGLIMICSLIMFAEVTDEYQYVKDVSRTGLIFALLTFGSKAASGMGKVIAGWMLQTIDFPSAQNIARLTPEILQSLAVLVSLWTLVIGCAALLMLSTYRLNRARHAEILAGLRARAALHAPASD
jgi:Na+/melibiose symporter-like transporter